MRLDGKIATSGRVKLAKATTALQMLRLSIDSLAEQEESSDRGAGPPPAPKRCRSTVFGRAERLAAFATAARMPNQGMSATRIESVYRGHIVRRQLRALRPTSASTSSNPDETLEEVPEEIFGDQEGECFGLSTLTLSSAPVDSALETSGELDMMDMMESSSDSIVTVPLMATVHERMCSICLGPMPRHLRNRPGEGGEGTIEPAVEQLAVTTLECGHKFHRRCILAWCRQKSPGLCPLCRVEVRARRSSVRPAVGP
jgi:hypothetical protein